MFNPGMMIQIFGQHGIAAKYQLNKYVMLFGHGRRSKF
jgi:hypothetical protein